MILYLPLAIVFKFNNLLPWDMYWGRMRKKEKNQIYVKAKELQKYADIKNCNTWNW